MPRKKTHRRQRKGGCHVCSNGSPVAIYKDENGFHLQVCSKTSCKWGYTFERDLHKPAVAS